MKFFKRLKKYPFLMMIALSTMIFTAIGFAGRNNIYSGYTIVLANTPQLAVVFEGAGEGKYPWMMIDKFKNQILLSQNNSDKNNVTNDLKVKDKDTEGKAYGQTITDISNVDLGSKVVNGITPAAHNTYRKDRNKDSFNKKKAEGNNSAADSKDKHDKVKNTSSKDNNSDSKKTVDKNTVKASKDITDTKAVKENAEPSEKDEYHFRTVTKDYFDDALFIGDSRTVGLSEYSDLDKSTFYADVGLTIYDIFDKKIADVDGDKKDILDALKIKKFGKIYIMLGINELGTGTEDTFTKQYKNVIVRIRKLQPDAIIFIQAIMNVAKEKSDTDPLYNNVNIKRRNDSIIKLADNSHIFYIDVNEAITDKKGNLPSEYTFDSVHLKAAYYRLWTNFLLKHGVAAEK